MFLRSFLVQGSWNYETLIGTGFAFVLLPVLRQIHGHDPAAVRDALRRHAEVFNSHPYLATLAAGAVARMEAEGASHEVVGRFKGALRSTLGSLGDQLVWLTWRPCCALLAIALLLLDAPWWLAVASFLVCYNALHIWLRLWGLEVGLRDGMAVGKVLRDSPLHAWIRRGAAAGMLLAGLCTALAVARAGPTITGLSVAVAAAAVGAWFGLRIGPAGFFILLAVWMGGVAVGFLS
jgi:mannose PTS system EIID component